MHLNPIQSVGKLTDGWVHGGCEIAPEVSGALCSYIKL